MQMKYELNSPPGSPNPLRKLAAFVVTAGLVGLALMFSVVLLAIILVVATIAWGYLWWKSRELRKRMRDFQSQAMAREQRADDDGVFEGEVIRVVDPQKGR
jgi:O-antigen/teichoic acid export membrane protein